VFLRRHRATPWYYWRGTACHSGVTSEGSHDTVAAERLRDAARHNSRKIKVVDVGQGHKIESQGQRSYIKVKVKVTVLKVKVIDEGQGHEIEGQGHKSKSRS